MPTHIATSADIPLILDLLAMSPNPPNENGTSIQQIIDGVDPIFVDSDAPAICRMHKRSGVNRIDVPWWTWDGVGNMAAKLSPVWTDGINDIIARYGSGSLSWPLGGNMPGFGANAASKRTDADARGEAVRTFLQVGLPADSVTCTRADNGLDCFVESTVQLMADRMGIPT